jgi:hypothetical protein
MLINQWMLLKFGWETREDNDPACGCMGFMFGFQTTFADSYSLVWQGKRWRD